MNYPDPIPAATRKHLDGLHARSERYARAHAVLSSELHDALMHGTEVSISTPSGAQRSMLACDVVWEDLAISSGRPSLLALFAMVASASRGEDVKAQAKAWIAQRCQEHADYHAADLAAEMRGAEREYEPDHEFNREVF